jgi:hypothetical protein
MSVGLGNPVDGRKSEESIGCRSRWVSATRTILTRLHSIVAKIIGIDIECEERVRDAAL